MLYKALFLFRFTGLGLLVTSLIGCVDGGEQYHYIYVRNRDACIDYAGRYEYLEFVSYDSSDKRCLLRQIPSR